MKPLARLVPLLLFACASNASNTESGPESQPLGGQTGDDGDLMPEPTPGKDPGVDPIDPTPGLPPQEDDCGYEERALSFDELTVFEASAHELAQRVDSSTSMFWVPFDNLPGTSYEPGAGETELSFEFAARTDAEVVQWGPPKNSDGGAAGHCRAEVRVPVWVDITTADGALDEHLAVTLYFHSGFHAEFNHDLAAADIDGSFRVSAAGEHQPGEQWEFEHLYIDVELWPDGSAGRIEPRFTLTNPGPPTPPEPPSMTGPPPLGPRDPADSEFTTPTHWSSVAVWPTRETCSNGGDVRELDSRVIGVSALDVIAELNANDAWLLETEGETQPAQFSVDVPDATYYCARRNGETLSFDVNATLSIESTNIESSSVESTASDEVETGDAGAGDAGSSGSALPALSATDVFEIRAKMSSTGLELSELAFSRTNVVYSLDRGQLDAALGVSLDLADEYREFWWDWHGDLTRDGDAWESEAELIVTSLNAEQSAEIEHQVSQGGPGAGISYGDDQWPQLPGDVLLRAVSEE